MAVRILDACVVIPHYAGPQLLECLDALYGCQNAPAAIVVVDDAGPGDAMDSAREAYPAIHVLRNEVNLGFVGACNRGLGFALEHGYEYSVLLNDDALVEPGWLEALVGAMSEDPSIAAAQPRIVSSHDPQRFEYAGAAGGMIDCYAYPYALGRWFDTVEVDKGQYDASREIFWASGAAACFRTSVMREIGTLDPVLKMHMEEIDWCWRAWLAGYRVISVPSARVRHYGALTLTTDRFRKIFLNHRNSIIMMVKNYGLRSLLCAFPFRLALEGLTMVGALLTGSPKRAAGACIGVLGLIPVLPVVLASRRTVQALRKRSDADVKRRMYPGSIALRYLMRRPAPEEPVQRSGER